MSTGGALVVQSLLANAIPFLFGVPDEPLLPVLEALRDTAGRVRFVACRHAASAAIMADAAGKLTGRAGVCIVSHAAGALDAAIGVHAALQACTPMVVLICPEHGRARRGAAPRDVDYHALYRPLTKWIAEVDDPEVLTEHLSRAFHGAHAGRPGPVALVLPPDVLAGEAMTRLPKPLKPAVAGASEAAVVAALALMARSARPLFVVGGAGWTPNAARDLARFADLNQIPVATAHGCPDGYDNRLPTYVGRLGSGVDRGSAPCAGDADLLVVVGPRLSAVTSTVLVEPPYAEQRLIHVVPDPDEIGRAFAPDLGVVASPAAFLAALAARSLEPSDRRQAWVRNARAAYEASRRPPEDRGGLDLVALVRRLDARLPENAVICTGSDWTAAAVQRHFVFKAPRTSLAPINGAGGYAVPAAVAAKLIAPGAIVVALLDGRTSQPSWHELGMAVQDGVPVIVIIAGGDPEPTSPDSAKLAACYGALGLVAADPVSFDAALDQALCAQQPVVISVEPGTPEDS